MPIRPVEIMEKHTYDPDKDGVIAEAQLFGAVCSETEAVAKVTFENLDAKGDVGPGTSQVAVGNHTHTLIVTEELESLSDTTGETDWTVSRQVTISGLKKITCWVVALGGYSAVVGSTGYCRITVDDVEKIAASSTSSEGNQSRRSQAVQYAGEPGVVKHEIKTSEEARPAGGDTGVYSIGV